jgi:hypothetical protein
MSYNWVSPDGGGEGSALVAKANVNAALKKLDDGSEEYNLMTDLYNQLDKCMQQNTGLRNEIKLLTSVEGGRRKTKSKRRKSKRRKRRRRTRRRQRGRG